MTSDRRATLAQTFDAMHAWESAISHTELHTQAEIGREVLEPLPELAHDGGRRRARLWAIFEAARAERHTMEGALAYLAFSEWLGMAFTERRPP